MAKTRRRSRKSTNTNGASQKLDHVAAIHKPLAIAIAAAIIIILTYAAVLIVFKVFT